MKCVCGHSDKEVGSAQFKEVLLQKDKNAASIEVKGASPWRQYTEAHTIYACPKCGTLKIYL